MKKIKFEDVKEFVQSKTDYQLLSKEYLTNCSKLHVVDLEGYHYSISYSDLRLGKKPNKFIKYNPYTIRNIQNWIETRGCEIEILSDIYIANGSSNKDLKLKFLCDVGHVFHKTWSSFSQHPSCNICNPPTTLKTHAEYVDEVYEIAGSEYEVVGTYVNAKTKIRIRHKLCGTEWSVMPTSILAGTGCPKNECSKLYGEENPRWNPLLTEEEKVRNRDLTKNIKWRKSIFEKYNYTCQICFEDTGNSVAHHLDGYNWAVDKRFDINNGVCMCEDHHLHFHKIYGYGDNTKEQYIQYKKDYSEKA